MSKKSDKYYESLDKRTKEYKRYLRRQEKAKAKFMLGDKIAQATKATGIDKAVKFVFGEDCGCKERQEKVNKAVLKAFGRRHVNALTEDEYNTIKDSLNSNKLDVNQQNELRAIHERIFNVRSTSSCSSCSFASQIYKPLLALINTYETE